LIVCIKLYAFSEGGISPRIVHQIVNSRRGRQRSTGGSGDPAANLPVAAALEAAVAPHVFGELFKMMTGIDLVHIPYLDRFWPAFVAGQTQILFAPVISATGYVQSGQLRALAVTTRTRLEAMPAIPALDEFVPGYEASGWRRCGRAAPLRSAEPWHTSTNEEP